MKKPSEGEYWQVVALCAVAMFVVLLAVFVSAGGMNKLQNLLAVNNIIPNSQQAAVVSVVVSPWYASPSSVTSGGTATLYWSATNADQCQFSGGWFGNALSPPNTTATYPGAQWLGTAYGYSTIVSGNSGSISTGPMNSSTTFYIRCQNLGPSNTGDSGWVSLYVPVGADNCPGNPTAVTGGLQVPAGTYHITAQGSNFCITNNSGKLVFIPTATAAEVNNFKAATQGYLSATIAYFARAAGY